MLPESQLAQFILLSRLASILGQSKAKAWITEKMQLSPQTNLHLLFLWALLECKVTAKDNTYRQGRKHVQPKVF